jgi:pimeloyl-ACP methyl ester carboxylesterase
MDSFAIRARGLDFPALAQGKGPLVLCLHGFPDCLRSFRHQLAALAGAGFRAVAPALRGYAPSCAGPLSDAHALEAARDAVEMVRALGEERAFLVGHDWGAAVAYLAAALAPQCFTALCTLSVPHPLGLLSVLPRFPAQLARSSYMAAFQARGLAERLLSLGDMRLIEALWKQWSPDFTPEPDELVAVKRTLSAPGVLSRTLAYYRALPKLRGAPLAEAHRLLQAPVVPPVLGIVGENDGCIAADVFCAAMAPQRFRSVRTLTIPAAGHFVHQENPQAVNDALLPWLLSQRSQ